MYDVTEWYQSHKTLEFSCISRHAGKDVTNDVDKAVVLEEWEPLKVGRVTNKIRTVEVFNTLSGQTHELQVCEEETLQEISLRLVKMNAHIGSYTWKHLERELDMAKTLDANGIEDDSEYVEDVSPRLYLYYNDDLTAM